MARFSKRHSVRNRIAAVLIILPLCLLAILLLIGKQERPRALNSEYESGITPAFEEGTHASDVVFSATAQEDIWTDQLISEEDVKNYTFEMTESGDAVLLITGLQEFWDGAVYHWRCSVYGDDLARAIAQADVRGYSVDYGPAVLSLPKLDAGTYCLQMASTSSMNPLMTSFTTDPYEIRLIKYYHSVMPAYDKKGLQIFRNADSILWAFDGTGFLKLNDGECFGALMKNRGGFVVPVLIGSDAASVEYIVSGTGEIITAKGPVHSQELGVDYYYSECDYINQYAGKSVNTSSLPMLYVDARSAHSATEEIINMQEDEKYRAEHGAVKYWIRKNKAIVYTVGGIFALVAVGMLLSFLGGPNYGSGSDYTDSYGYMLSDEENDAADALRRAIKITETYGEDWIGYDPEASSPDDIC